nr:hypothetical protein CFP56_39707 [Quercus suber]
MGDLENKLLILSSGLRTISSPLNAPLHLLEVEAKAMGEGIRFAWQMGNCNAVLEGDSQKVVVHSLLGSSISSLSISINISGTLLQLQLYQSVQISHVAREGNKATHALAQYVRGISYFFNWIRESPCILV